MIRRICLFAALVLCMTGMANTKGAAVQPDDAESIDVTVEYLSESNNFSRGDDGRTRFGKAAYWMVENYGIDNGGSGVKNGIDNFLGYNSLQLGAWEENPNDAGLENSRLYQKVKLPAGRYYFGAKYQYVEQDKFTATNRGYLLVADRLLTTAEVEAGAMAYASMATVSHNGSFYGVMFDLAEEQEVYLGWQMDSRFWHSEFRATDVLMLKYGADAYETESLTTFASPNGKFAVELSQSAQQTFLTLTTSAGTVITKTPLGLTTNKENLWKGLQLASITEPEHVAVSYTNIHGKKGLVENEANKVVAAFKNESGDVLEVEMQAYNDGLAFRYHIPDEADAVKRIFLSEQTSYEIDHGAHRWIQPFSTPYEGDFPYQATGGQQGAWCYPALFEIDGMFALITEANANRMYCSTHLDNSSNSNKYKVSFPFAYEGNNMGDVNPVWTGGWTSPWRVVIAGELKDIVESTLVEDVSDPCKLANTDFVEPGSAAWVYWAYNHGTRDYKICCQYVDLAASMGWKYVLFDWEWDSMTNGGNLQDAVAYAYSKGVEPWMWYNSGGPHNTVGSTPRDRMLTHENRVAEFTWLKSLGVVGVKIDFFESDKQSMMQYYLDILDDAADFEMMVNFHGCTMPRGWSRTYPHLMSMEAVCGAEQYNNGGFMTNEGARINCLLPYTRNVVGPMDYTPVAFTDSQYPHTTTFAHELALSVAFESGVQHWADRPEGFYALPLLASLHMKEVPIVWDETRFVDGYPGKSFVVARRSGSTWYVAGLQGENVATTFEVALDFLGEGDYVGVLIGDGDVARTFGFSAMTLKRGQKVAVDCLGRGGFVLTLKQADAVTMEQLQDLQKEVEKALQETEGRVGMNSGYYSKEAVEELQSVLAESYKVTEATEDAERSAVYMQLLMSYSDFQTNGWVPGGKWMGLDGWEDVTADYLVEASNFSRNDETVDPNTRFGLLAEPWVVTDGIINQDNNTHGGFDGYEGGRAISIEKWNGGEKAMVDDKLYQTTKVEVPAGKYSLRMVVTAREGFTDNESCMLRVVKGEAFPGRDENEELVLASYNMVNTAYSGTYMVCQFELAEPAVLSIGWVVNLSTESARNAMRVTAIRLLNESGKDVSADYLENYQNIQRKDRSYRRFGAPTHWEVEDFQVDNGGDGVKQGIDSYPGYSCLMLGVWDDSNRAVGSLAKARMWRQITLPAGRYFFGGAFEALYNLKQAFIYAAATSLTAAETEKEALAYYNISEAAISNDLYGIFFTLNKETTLCLGWNADLTTSSQMEFRVKSLALLKDPDFSVGEEDVVTEVHDNNSPVRVYDLQGRLLNDARSLPHGVYILCQGVNVRKVYVE